MNAGANAWWLSHASGLENSCNPGERLRTMWRRLTKYSIPAHSLPIPIATGQQIDGSVVIGAFSGTASAINITGYIIAVR